MVNLYSDSILLRHMIEIMSGGHVITNNDHLGDTRDSSRVYSSVLMFYSGGSIVEFLLSLGN